MRLFLLPPDFHGQNSLTLTGNDSNYIVNVLRLKEGCQITGRDRDGKTYLLTVEKIKKGSCTLSAEPLEEAVETTDALPDSRPEKTIILYQCLPKGRKMDEIIKRATEMGVRAIVPVKSKNCVAEISDSATKSSRYSALVREAVQQSGSLVPTEVCESIALEEIPGHFKSKSEQKLCGLFFHQNTLEENQKNLLSLLEDPENRDCAYAVVVGPEGGFEEGECRFLMENSFHPVLLKTNILRCETAALYAVAAIQTISESL
ncbi:MAG: RsmE family RNA methyltransferase [Sphaerochaetaceae bacterium]|nr:RsmE family RNA methyltransferase [Sphaerochaetaceae bacterium]